MKSFSVDLTNGRIMRSVMLFAFPMILGDLLQQGYNIADTIIVGRFLGTECLAAVGASYALMTFLTSVIIGLCLGSGALFSISYGKNDFQRLSSDLKAAFILTGITAAAITVIPYLLIDSLKSIMFVPDNVWGYMRKYLIIIFSGTPAVFIYNYFACYLRAVGNSVVPLAFLAISAALNIALDIYFVPVLRKGVGGAAIATVLSQYISALCIAAYSLKKATYIRGMPKKTSGTKSLKSRFKEVALFSYLTCIQQSVMNLGILTVQSLVNSFGSVVMAAFAAGVKIDAFAYMPVQDFGNAASTFFAQNYGAKKEKRIKSGFIGSILLTATFGVCASAFVYIFAENLCGIFVDADQINVIEAGVRYLRIEGLFYAAIGVLFILYGLYRGVALPQISVVLTVMSLGLRVALAYALSPGYGTEGIWVSVPIGWGIADVVGIIYWFANKNKIFNVMRRQPI